MNSEYETPHPDPHACLIGVTFIYVHGFTYMYM